ncbi:FAD:protein FMN transferase [Massilia sp. TWR1-2-2]|uniref:FAD:protein FMN transferase n=1 Tax=Massilia sp. TWR1-2-2 TaxID=2804584 RepID=UPI003CF6210F
MLRRKFLAASLGTMASAMAPPSIQRTGQLFTGATLAFGTTVSVSVVHDDERQAAAAIRDALDQATQVDRLMSIYNPASQVFQLNRDGVLAQPHPHLLTVLRQAQALSEMTRGAFDITVQPLWQAYRNAADQSALPSPRQRRQAKLRVDWRRLAISAERVSLGKAGAAITLNGLAQGYAADLAMAAVRARGIEHALLDTGEFSAHGNNGRHPWTLGVLHPRDNDALAAVLCPHGRCVATSGDYASTFTPDFAHHHIFDPTTGDSPPELASATVLAPTALLADGLSTAFMVMGARKAHALARSLPAVDLMTINKRGVVWKSPAFPPAA